MQEDASISTQIVARGVARLPTGSKVVGRLHVFQEGAHEHLALVFGEVSDGAPVVTRIHSSCVTGDVFRSVRCDCGKQLAAAQTRIEAMGRGIVLRLDQEGRGIGIVAKLAAYALQDAGFDTFEANALLGHAEDGRTYEAAAVILDSLGVRSVVLDTNNPEKSAALRRAGITVVEEPCDVAPTIESREYVDAKARRSMSRRRDINDRRNVHECPVTAVAFDQLGRPYVGRYDHRVVAFERDGRTIRWMRSHNQLVNALQVVGGHLVTVSADRRVIGWSLEDGRRAWVTNDAHADDLNTLAVSPDQKFFVVGGEEGAVVRYEVGATSCSWRRTLPGAPCINGITFGREDDGGPRIYVGTDDGFVSTLDADGNLSVRRDLGDTVECLASEPTGTVFAGLEGGDVVRLDPETLAPVAKVHHHDAAAKSIVIASDGTLISAGYDATIRLTRDGQTRTLAMAGAAWRGWGRGLALSPVAPTRLAVSALGAAPQFWNTCSNQLEQPDVEATPGWNALSVDQTDAIYVAGDRGEIWRIQGEDSTLVNTVDSLVNGLAIRPGATTLAVACMDGHLVLMQDDTISRRRLFNGPVNAVAFNDMGTHLAVGGYDGRVVIESLDGSGPPKVLAASAAVKSLSFGGELLIAGLADGTLVAWDMAGAVAFRVEGLELVNGVAWSQARRQFATVGRDRVVRVFDPKGVLVTSARAHDRSIKAVAWSSDGTRLATAGYDPRIIIWRVEDTLVSETVTDAHLAPGVPAVAFLSDGRVASAGWDGTVRIHGTESRILLDRREAL